MTGHKKIVGLWRDSDTNQEADSAAPVTEAASETSLAPEIASDPERDWLAPAQPTENWDDEQTAAPSPWRDRIAPMVMIALALGWTGFALLAVTDGWRNAPTLAELPTLIATIAMPLTMILLVWMLMQRSGRSEQARFARVAAALREENLALNQSMHSLGLHLADAQKQLSEQARIVQQLGLDTVMRLSESSDRLASNASVIANAHDQLARSGDVAMQRMDGLLAGLPRIDDVAQRLAVNFREAGLVAHQQGANLEARLAALGEEAAKTAQIGTASTAGVVEAIGALREQGKQTESDLLTTSAKVAKAHDEALARITDAAASVRDDMTSVIAELTSRVDDSWRQFRQGLDSAATQMDDRLGAAHEASETLGAQISAHAGAADTLAARIAAHSNDAAGQLADLDARVTASTDIVAHAITDTKAQLAAFLDQVQNGNGAAHQLITHAESLLLALDAVTRELDETLPHALDRITAHGQTTQTALSQLRPLLDASELVAQSTVSHVHAVQATLKNNGQQMASQATDQQALVDRLNASMADADAALAKLRQNADSFAAEGGARMVATLDDVRAAADTAANDARQTLEKLVADARDTLHASASEALDEAMSAKVIEQLGAIEQAAARAVAAANGAADRLMQQLVTIRDTSISVEQRVSEAEQAIAASDRDSLAKQVGVLTEALKSTAIDVTKILSSEVSDSAWDAYLKGDRGVFARRAVKLIDNSETKEILRLYQGDDAFHAAVNQFIHDFEAMLRLLIGARDGSAISVTLLSSDIGKLYVALAQAIDRLRN